jgi:hypothetical protein
VKRAILLFGTILFFVSLTAWAQDTATIVGAVLDSTGAVIPGAKVTVANAAKGFHRDLVANAAGEWNAYKIPLGDYVITAEAPGFQKLVRSGITVAVGQTLRVDLQLTVGQVTQEVTVTGNITRVETETAAISDVVTGHQIANLELNGRNWVTLALLVPGASPRNDLDTSHVGVAGNSNVSFNGGRTQYNNWEVDGGPNTDEGSASTFNTYPSLDTIAEFRISTSNFGADMGKHAGATIEVATKSGTRDFHGAAFEYVRNNKFDANPWFVNREINPPGGNAPITPRKWNDYGYNLGGPFYIPGHYNTDKSKTFFFWSENWRKYREGTVVGGNVPTTRMRTGDFSECHGPGLLNPTDPGSPNYNPVISGCTLPTVGGVKVDTVAVDQHAQTLMDAFIPLPNSGVTGYIQAPSTATNWRQEQIRVDQNIGEKTRVFVRYTQDAWNTVIVPTLWQWGSYDTVGTPFGGPGKSAVLNIAHTFKPNLMNEFVMGYTVDHIVLNYQVGASSVSGTLAKPDWWNATTNNFFAPNKAVDQIPDIAVCGGIPFCIWEGTGGYNPWYNSNPIITWKDNLAYTVGKHTLKLGFFLEKYRKNEQFGAPVQGSYQFGGGWGSNSTGNGLADMFLGRISSYSEGTRTVGGVPVGGYAKGYWRMTAFEPYIQDDWKISRKLTLNLGARYYLFTRIHDVGRPTIDSSFIPGLYNPDVEKLLLSNGNFDNTPAALASGHVHDFTTNGNGLMECGTGAILKGCQTPYYWTLAPRFGFAYDPWGNGKTVIRGGYGIYFEMGNGNEAQTEGMEGNPPAVAAPGVSSVTGYASPDLAPGSYGPPGIATIPYSQKWGSVQQFSFGVQHEFRGNNVLGVSWVGSLGRHLARGRDINQIPVGIGNVYVPALEDGTNCGIVDPAGSGHLLCDVQTILINHSPTSNSNFFRPYVGYGGITQKENTAVSSYNSLQVSFRHVFGYGLTFQTSYTWAHAIDDDSSTYSNGQIGGVDASNLSRWKATSDMNRTHVLVLNYVYAMPFFKNSSGPVKSILGGWTISGITSFFSGEPVMFGCGIANHSSGIGGNINCNTVGNLQIKKGTYLDPEYGPTPSWFDAGAIAQPTLDQLRADGQPGMFGYMGRNPLTGPGRNNWDLALLKDFQLPWFKAEHSTLQFRLETFNTFNHPQWRGISVGCSDQTAPGAPCNDEANNRGNGTVNRAWDSRIMQLGLRFSF